MGITKDSKKVLKAEIREINRRIDRVNQKLTKINQERNLLQAELDAFRDMKDNLKADADKA